MSIIAEVPGQNATPPAQPPSTPGTGAENTVTPPDPTKAATPPATLAPDLDAEEEAHKAKHGDGWAIKAYREEKKASLKYKDIREAVDKIGNPELVKTGLQAIDALGDPTVPIGDAIAEVRAFDDDRYQEMRNYHYGEFIDQYPDHVLTDIVGQQVTVAQVKAALSGPTASKPASSKVNKIEISDDLRDDYPEVAELLEKLQAQNSEDTPAAKPPDADKSVELEKQLNALKTEQQRNAYLEDVQKEGAKLYDEVFSEVDEALSELGLAPDKDDPEDLASLKEAARDYLGDRARVETAFDSVEENVKIANRITEHLARRQYAKARAYVPASKIAARAAVEALASDRKGKALVDAVKRELQALAQSGKKGSGGKGPLIGGTVPGAPPPTYTHGKGDDALWDEMEGRLRARRNAG